MTAGVIVALRKESVDRNWRDAVGLDYDPIVALRKESVDRNSQSSKSRALRTLSLSARRAWIEIFPPIELCHEQEGRSPQGERG